MNERDLIGYKRPVQQIVFSHGPETLRDDGSTVQRSSIRALNGKLPAGMFAYFETVRSADGVVRVYGTLQARSIHGRRQRLRPFG